MKKIFISVAALIIALMSTAVAVFGWLTVGTQIQPNYTGSVPSSYFASGDGSKNDAYEINRPNHLYNLAWLQNNGFFTTQRYFKITDDLDMSGYVLPPIGTKDNPFIGILDGNNKTISNLTVSNVLRIDDNTMPDEVSLVPKKYNENAIGNGYTDIVGFFGVIGHYPDSTSVCPNNVSVSNLFLDNLTVRTRTDNSLIGLFAGYVCGSVENVGVYRSMVSIGSGVSTLSSGFAAHSNYSLIGDYHGDSTGWEAIGGGSGSAGAGFGGSIDMQLLSRRVGYMITSMLANADEYANTSAAYQVTFDTDSIANARNYYKDKESLYNLNIYKNRSSNITTIPEGAFYYKNEALTSTSNKYIDCAFLSKTYLPLNIDLEAMHLTDKYGEIKEDGTLTAISGTYYYNDIYKNGIGEERKEAVSASNTGYLVGGGDNSASIQVNLRIAPLNYGSGLSTGYLTGTIYKSLRYNISNSSPYTYSNSNSNTVSYTGTNLDLVTNVGGTFYRIVDSKNTTDTTSVVLSDLTTINSSSLSRYDSVRTQFGTMLEDNLIYGLQFKKLPSKDATITGNVTIKDSANTSTYSDYVLVKSAINFNLSQPGYMTTIMGGYGTMIYNQGGFSLYKVVRSEDKSTINEFTEITTVWLNDNAGTDIEDSDIVYNETANDNDKYTYNNITYTKVYDSSWYNSGTDGQIEPGVAYYVEIPLKTGDYCLGGAGLYYAAYLMYLDIGANGGSGGSGGSETTKSNKIDGVRFVYLLSDTYASLENLFTFEIVRAATTGGVQIYFLMTSSDMYYHVDIDTTNTTVTPNTSATLNETAKTQYGGTKYAPS